MNITKRKNIRNKKILFFKHVCDSTMTFTLCAATLCSSIFSRTLFMNDELTGLAVASPSSQSTGTVGGMLPSSPSSRSSLHTTRNVNVVKEGYECQRAVSLRTSELGWSPSYRPRPRPNSRSRPFRRRRRQNRSRRRCGCPVSYRLHSAAEGRADTREVCRLADEAVRVSEEDIRRTEVLDRQPPGAALGAATKAAGGVGSPLHR
jgi:hypothetical protein